MTNTPKDWVDFAEVKTAVTIEMVLTWYAISNLKRTGEELRGPCPIHKGSSQSKDFTVNIRKSAFKCFSKKCGARGNVLDLVALMEHCSVRDAALKLKAWFGVGESVTTPEIHKQDREPREKTPSGIYSNNEGELFEVIANAQSAEDLEPCVIYRELFGDFRFWVAPHDAFSGSNREEQGSFTLVKAL